METQTQLKMPATGLSIQASIRAGNKDKGIRAAAVALAVMVVAAAEDVVVTNRSPESGLPIFRTVIPF